MTVTERQNELIGDLLIIEDVQERLGAVVARAAKRTLPEDLKTDPHRVNGCVSRVWLVFGRDGSRLTIRCDAESPMVKGLVALLCDVYDGGEAAEVAAVEPDLWERLGFAKMITPTRLNGLAAVRARIRAVAAGDVASEQDRTC